MDTRTDILIPLMHDGSKYNNFELRMCLRSIEKHLKNYSNVYIVGELPTWINPQTIIHIPFEDSTDSKQRAWNIYRKIIAGINYFDWNEDCEEKDVISDNFLFMNDDHFLLTDYIAGEFPYYHRGQIQTHRVGNEAQRIQMENTVKLFYKNPILDFGVHCPIVYNKKLFIEAFKGLEWQDYGYEIKSVYCSKRMRTKDEFALKIQMYGDFKFSEPAMKESIYIALENRSWFSVGDKCLKSGAMQEVLQELYSIKSKYEL